MTGQIVIIGALVAVILFFTGRLLYLRWKSRTKWVRLTDWNNVFVNEEAPVDHARLDTALTKAATFLEQCHPLWFNQTSRVLDKSLHIFVMPTDVFHNLDGSKVAGIQNDDQLVVGPALGALCHELAHRYEQVLEGKVDYGHVQWTKNGIHQAIGYYEAWRSTT